MSAIVLEPNMRYAFVGKTRSGKTHAALVLACLLVPVTHRTWQLWWLDSKMDPKDGAMLRRWGFGKRFGARKHIKLDPKNGDIRLQAQQWCHKALERGNVLLVIDEYAHVVMNTKTAGSGIKDVLQRGGGLNVGLIGQTQEPVQIPRQLLSQASVTFLHDLSYPPDIKYVRGLYDGYRRPPDPWGFFFAHIDGDASWHYFPHIKAWHDLATGMPAKVTA